MNIEKSQEWHTRAQASIPGGVSSPVRAFSAVGGTPRYFVRGEGSRVWDVDGNAYIDLVGSWGPMILGHAPASVVDAVAKTISASFSFGAPHPNETLLAEEITHRVEVAERVRFVSSGTEAVMTAVRLARGATGRDLVVKFSGCYHGHSDALLVAAGSGVATLGLPNSPGVTEGAARDTLVVEYNDRSALEAIFAEHGDRIAAVITEATPANMGVVPPAEGFNKFIAELTKAHGALMILDEVMTGFRISRGGWWEKFGKPEGWRPDLITFGKVIGGGFPVAAVAGRADVMNQLAPNGPIYQAGTLSGNPVATTAGLETLKNCTPELYARLDHLAKAVGEGISAIFAAHGIRHSYQSAGNLFSFFFDVDSVASHLDAKAQKPEWFSVFFNEMLEQGVSIPPSAFEAWFVSGAMTDEDVEDVLRAADVAAAKLAEHINS